MKTGLSDIRTSILAVPLLAFLLCGFYPALVFVLGGALFPFRAGGSLVMIDGNVRGSYLLARGFAGPEFFHPRPSAAGRGWEATRSGGSNLGPLSKELSEVVRRRVEAYRAENGLPEGTLVPGDAVTASASGLDPDISPENARLQARRVARARGLPEAMVLALIDRTAEGRTLGFLGRPRVNVWKLNLALEEAAHGR